MQFAVYALLSIFALGAKLAQVFSKFQQPYPAAVHLTEDRVSQALFMNFGCMLLISFGRIMLSIFCGKLRDLEVESLVDSCKSVIADTLIIFVFYGPTVDGQEVRTGVLIVAVCLMIYMKVFHIISSIRVSNMFEIGIPNNSTIYRLFALLLLLILIDSVVIRYFHALYSVNSTFYTWALFEGVTLLISALSTLTKLQLNLIDIRLPNGGLPNKPVLIFYVDLVHDLLQMTSYCVFMLLFVLNHPGRLPLYAISDFAQVARQLIAKLRSFRKYRQLTRNMETAFVSPSLTECARAGDCIICRDALLSSEHHPNTEDEGQDEEEEALEKSCKKLSCSHVYHTECLKNWLLMQQTCPTCRAEIRPADRRTRGPAAPPAAAAAAAEPAARPEPEPDEDEDAVAFAELREGGAETEEGGRRRESERTEVTVRSRRRGSSGGFSVPTPTQQMLVTHALAMRDYYRLQVQYWREQLEGGEVPGTPPADLVFE